MPAADDILTLTEVAAALRLDPRTVRRVASELGGRRCGSRWRFRWGTVMEWFDAYTVKASKQRMSRPTRARGLKLDGRADKAPMPQSRPTRARGLLRRRSSWHFPATEVKSGKLA